MSHIQLESNGRERAASLASRRRGPSWVASGALLVVLGAPGSVAHAGSAPVAADYFTVPPCRLLDTRILAQPLLDGVERSNIPIANDTAPPECDVPVGAMAVALNVTSLPGTASGRLTLYPGGTTEPAAGAVDRVHFAAKARANNALAESLSAAGTLDATAHCTGGCAPGIHLVLDVVGYFLATPVAVDDGATVDEDDPTTPIPVLTNDTLNGVPTTIASASDPVNGAVALTPAGPGPYTGLTYQPDPDYCNAPPGTTTDTFTYSLTPGGGTATVSVMVNCVNDNPLANDDPATVAEDDPATAIPVLANDTDAETDPLTIAAASDPANGTVVLTGGSPGAHTGLTYQPDPDYCNAPPGSALDTFTYTLNPGGDTATVSVTVNCANDPPVANDDGATVTEDSPATAIPVLANDTDADSDPFTIAAASDPANGTVVLTGGSPGAHTGLTYQPDTNYCNNPPGSSPDTFTYTLNPGGDSATVAVTVDCVNDAPVANDDSATVAEDATTAAIPVLTNDADLEVDPFTIASASDPQSGTVLLTGGSPGAHTGLTYQPDANYCNDPPGSSPDTFTYTLNPGGDSATVAMTVTCGNDGPAIDLDADDSGGTAGTGYAITFTEGDAAKFLQDAADATITDVDSTTLTTLAVTLTNLLDAGAEVLDVDLTGADPAFTKNYDTTTPGQGVLTVTAAPARPIADFVTLLRKVTYIDSDQAPDATARVVSFVANDGTNNGSTVVSTVTVVPVDDPPVAVADGATVNEDSGANAIAVLANDTDLDGGPQNVASATDPANGTVVLTPVGPGPYTGLTYQPDPNYCNSVTGIPDSFSYTLTPGSSSTTVTVTVTCVDDPPVAVADSATVNEDASATAIDVLANDTDVDAGPKNVASATDPANGTVVITPVGPGPYTGLTYQPDPNYCNSVSGIPDTFNYTLTPGLSTTVSVTVTCVDDPPVAVANSTTVNEDAGATAIDVLANDTDVDAGQKNVASATDPANGTVVLTPIGPGPYTGLTYQPDLNYCNSVAGIPDTFGYTLTPGSSSTTVSVTVTCVNDPPVANADSADITEEAPNVGATNVVSGNVLSNDTDPDGPALTVSAVAGGSVGSPRAGSYGSVTIQSNGTFAYTLDDTLAAVNGLAVGQSLTDAFGYTASDGSLASSSTLTVTIHGADDPPTPDNDAFDFIGNTQLEVDRDTASTPEVLATTPPVPAALGVLDGDLDPDGGPAISIASVVGCGDSSAPFDCVLAGHGTLSLQGDGSFGFIPEAGDLDATATFQYTLTGNPAPATVTLTRFQRVWYVKNNDGGGTGVSTDPLATLFGAQAAATTNDTLFAYLGDGTSTGQAAGILLQGGQRLLGEHAGLVVTLPGPGTFNGATLPIDVTLAAAVPGNRPLIDHTAAFQNAVQAVGAMPVEIAGVSLSSTQGDAISITSGQAQPTNPTLTIRDNVIRGAGAQGIDVDVVAGHTGTLTINLTGNSWTPAGTHTGIAVDIINTSGVADSLRLDLSDNTNLTSAATALSIDSGAVNATTVTGFADNSIHQNSLGAGAFLRNLTFDATPGGAFQQVDGDTLRIGIAGDGVGQRGLELNAVQGNLFFDDLDVYSANTALEVSGTGGGLTLAVAPAAPDGAGTSTLAGTGPDFGAALVASNATLDLRLALLQAAITGVPGFSLSGISGQVSANAGSAITKGSGGNPAFRVTNSPATINYRGTLGVTAGGSAGEGVVLVNTGTVNFTGALTLSTGNTTAFSATGGGTVTATHADSTLSTTTATALNVNGTTIGAANLTFRSISAGTAASGPANGILLSNTGTQGGLKVTGTGSAGTGGTIQRCSLAGVSLAGTSAVSLAWMSIINNQDDGITGTGVAGFSLANSSVAGNGNSTSDEGIYLENPSGALAFSTVTVTGNAHNNLFIYDSNNSGGNTTLSISGSSFSSTGNANGNHGALVDFNGTSFLGTSAISSTNFSNNKVIGLQVLSGDSATISDLTVQSCSFNDSGTGNSQEISLDAAKAGTSNMTIKVLNNTGITGHNSHGMNFFTAAGAGTTGTYNARVEGNTIGNAAVAGSGSLIGNCMRININGDADASVLVNNNTLRQCPNGRGIEIIGRNGTGGLDVTVTNNDVNPNDVSGFPLCAILVQSNAVTIANTVRSDVRGNTVPAGTAFDVATSFLGVIETGASTSELVDTAPASASCTAQLTSTNTGSASANAGCALIAGPISTPP